MIQTHEQLHQALEQLCVESCIGSLDFIIEENRSHQIKVQVIDTDAGTTAYETPGFMLTRQNAFNHIAHLMIIDANMTETKLLNIIQNIGQAA